MIRVPALVVALVSVITGGTSGPSAQNIAANNPRVQTVDFVAVDANGAPVLDLQPSEISVRVGSHDRTVRALELVRIAPLTTDSVPEPFGSSVAPKPSTRTLLVVLDDESMRPGRESGARDAVSRLLSSLAPNDRVGIVTVPLGGIRLDLTTDHAKARRVFNELNGKAPRTETSTEFACRSRRTLETLTGLLNAMSVGRAPLTVIFVSSALSGPTHDPGSARSIGTGMCEIQPDKFEELGIAAAQSRASVYVIQPEDAMVQPGSVSAADLAGRRITDLAAGLEHLAGVTGGALLRLGGATSDTVERILGGASTYYLASLDPLPDDGGVTRLDVKTSRPDVVIRARPRIALRKIDADAGRKSSVTPHDMLRQSHTFSEFALRALGYVSANPGDTRMRVVAVAESEPGATLAGAAVGIFDPAGRLVAQWTARPEELNGTSMMAAMLVEPGDYRLRVAAMDSLGRAATADYALAATLASAGAIRMSDLLLGLSREGRFQPRMVFSAEPTAIAQVELIGVPAGEPPTARFEIARSENGTALSSTPGAITPTPETGRAILSGVLPIGALPPGDYVIRAVVTAPAGGPSGRVLRTLRKVR